jgi:hypothetical protein
MTHTPYEEVAQAVYHMLIDLYIPWLKSNKLR